VVYVSVQTHAYMIYTVQLIAFSRT